MLNDFDRTFVGGNTFVFKASDVFVREGGLFVYLNNANANWRRNEPDVLQHVAIEGSSRPCVRTDTDDRVHCTGFEQVRSPCAAGLHSFGWLVGSSTPPSPRKASASSTARLPPPLLPMLVRARQRAPFG